MPLLHISNRYYNNPASIKNWHISFNSSFFWQPITANILPFKATCDWPNTTAATAHTVCGVAKLMLGIWWSWQFSGGILRYWRLPFTWWVLNDVLCWYWYHFRGTGIVIFLNDTLQSRGMDLIKIKMLVFHYGIQYQDYEVLWIYGSVTLNYPFNTNHS